MNFNNVDFYRVLELCCFEWFQNFAKKQKEAEAVLELCCFEWFQNADAFFHAIQTGLNIQMDTLNEMKLKTHTDLEKQAEIVKYLDVIEMMEIKEETTIELLKQAKQTNLSEMFAKEV